MAKRARRRISNGARRRKPLRRVSANDRWLHLSASDITARNTLQTVWGWTSVVCSFSLYLTALTTAIGEAAAANMIPAEIDDMLSLLGSNTACFISLLRVCRNMDSNLYDIAPVEEEQPRQYTAHKKLRIDDLSDPKAHKMTHFYHGQLLRLYNMFDLEGYLRSIDEDKIPLYTGHMRNNTPCRYLIDPEELFLFTLCKIATGRTNQSIVDEYFGGDYARWSFGYPWMVRYLDDRYKNIIGYQGLARYTHEFPRFNRAIEKHARKDRAIENMDGSYTIVPGLKFIPWDIFGFIDDSIYGTSTPFSGPRGDYVGAARKVEYLDTQEAFYTGYQKLHGFKVETCFLPNGLSFLFGPVSARRGDAGVLRMSNLNPFLVWIQHGMFRLATGTAVYFGLFGDTAFNLGYECIQSYYRAYGVGAQLSDAEKQCNNVVKAARITIERNYGMTSTIFRICNSKEGFKLAKKNPYAIEQMRVVHLLVNCYICLNGVQASSDNTFGISPPKLEAYLAL